jgi:tetratricopeptide (TPR) repeat protein
MRNVLAFICGMLLRATTAPAQSAGIPASTTHTLTAVSEMGRPATRLEDLSRSTTFEEGDDPTVAAHSVIPHEPLRAARKTGDKAEHLARKQQHEEAVTKYREAVALDPLYFQAWNNLALELDAAGHADEAVQVFRRLMQSNPEYVLVFSNLATLLSQQKRYAEAEDVARQAMRRHKFSFKANLVLGTVLIDQNKWTGEAKTALEYAQVKYSDAKSLLDRWPAQAAQN